MLYIVGGTARSGKSTLARKILKEKQIPYFSIDQLLIGLEKGKPELDIKSSQNTLQRALRMWPIVKPLLVNTHESEPVYLIEGDVLMPEYMSQLQREIEYVKVCYLGYAEVDPKGKFDEIKSYKGPNNWTKEIKDSALYEMITSWVEISKIIRDEADKYNYPYFDTSESFHKAGSDAFNFLTKRRSQNNKSRTGTI